MALEVELGVTFAAGTGAIVAYAAEPTVSFAFAPMPSVGTAFSYDASGAAVLGDYTSEFTPPTASNFNLEPAPPRAQSVSATGPNGPCVAVGPNNPAILGDHISYVRFDCG